MAGGGTSERACDRCRERRVKCDKRIPACFRCEKLGKPCPGYDKKRKFVDEGISLRKKYQTSHSRESSLDQPLQQDDAPTAAGANTSHQRLISPPLETVTTAVTLSPAHNVRENAPPFDFPSVESYTAIHQNPPPSLDALPLPVTDSQLFSDTSVPFEDVNFFNDPGLDPAWFDIEPDVFFGPLGHSCGFVPVVPNIVDDVDRSNVVSTTEINAQTPKSLGGLSGSMVWAPESQMHTSAIITDEREHEMAYLIRHFTEAIGPWMDLFDQSKHFSNLVPLKALHDALLRNAIAAVAAKQLGRVKGAKCYVGPQCQKPATMEVIEDVPVTDWFYKAANYYDKAIAFSRLYLRAITGSLSSPPTPSMQETVSIANSDDLLVAVSIFSLYEALDDQETSWLQHLAGFRTLLHTITLDPKHPSKPSNRLFTVGRFASMWNFIRSDYQAAFINRQHTFLNPENISLWGQGGLQLQEDGSLYHDPLAIKNNTSDPQGTAVVVSHTMLYIVLRVMNYLAIDSDVDPTVRQVRWLSITRQLGEWHTHLPSTFQPCAQIDYPLKNRSRQLTEVFFTMPVCAAAMQLYHFARILLLLHQPIHSSAKPSDALKHAHYILGIALGRPPPAVRVEMLLPLYVAGLCLEDMEERRVLLELMRAIEMDTGCETEARCLELERRWGWPKSSTYGSVLL